MVARGLRLDHRRRAARVEAGEQHRRLDLRRGDRRAIFDRRGLAGPLSTIGQRPPSASARTCAPISLSGSRMRRIGRLRSEASPSKVAVIRGRRRRPSSAARRCRRCRNRASRAAAEARRARGRESAIGRAQTARSPRRAPRTLCRCPSTSSPSSSPSTFVSPQASSPNRKARCEIDLSPGGRTRPLSGRARTALRGDAARECDE